jgi:hypothetical protein
MVDLRAALRWSWAPPPPPRAAQSRTPPPSSVCRLRCRAVPRREGERHRPSSSPNRPPPESTVVAPHSPGSNASAPRRTPPEIGVRVHGGELEAPPLPPYPGAIAVVWTSLGPLPQWVPGRQDRLLGGPLGLPGLCHTAPDGVRRNDYGGEVLR